jgi:hypothetical protein
MSADTVQNTSVGGASSMLETQGQTQKCWRSCSVCMHAACTHKEKYLAANKETSAKNGNHIAKDKANPKGNPHGPSSAFQPGADLS